VRTAILIAALLATTSMAAAETMYYGSRAGMVVTVVKKSNLNSTHAKITAKHTRENAVQFCREYVQKVTEKCIADNMAEGKDLLKEISANCRTGKFVTLYGQGYQFRGPNPNYDPAGISTEYLLYQVGDKEPLDGSMASGYPVALEQFKALCPKRMD
jgi:hypothetical protein